MKPTEAQIGVLFRWFTWQMPREKACAAMKYLQDNATRKEVSEEISRVHDLYHSRKLDEERCFETPIWKEFHFVEPIRAKEVLHGE